MVLTVDRVPLMSDRWCMSSAHPFDFVRTGRVSRRLAAIAVAAFCVMCLYTNPARAGDQPLPARLITADQWGSVTAPEASYRSRRHEKVDGLTVHHQGEIWNAGADVASYLRRLQQWSRRERAWVDVPYHYIVAPDGVVWAGRDTAWAGDSNTDYDTAGQLQIMLLGNFEEQRPTPAQLQSTAGLLAHLMTVHGVSSDSIVAHRHHTTQTVCPGAHLMSVFEDLRQSAAALSVAARPR